MRNEFIKDNEGATSTEYGLIAALIAVVLLGVFHTLSNNLEDAWYGVADATHPRCPAEPCDPPDDMGDHGDEKHEGDAREEDERLPPRR